jgi:hypothetical protein
MVGDRVVTWGDDGLEVVSRAGGTLRRTRALGRGEVGSVSAVAEADGMLFVAGSRGLLRTPLGGGPVESLLPNALRGLAIDGTSLYLLDERWVYAGPLADPRRERFAPILDLTRALDPRSLRVGDGMAVVVGKRGLACAELSARGPARLLSRYDVSETGRVSDAAVVSGVVFLVGDRGLQALDPRRGRILDSVDVEGRLALGAAGRHVVVLGSGNLQVVDATPWTAAAMPAALDRAAR